MTKFFEILEEDKKIQKQRNNWEPIKLQFYVSLCLKRDKRIRRKFWIYKKFSFEKRLTAMISILELSIWISNFCFFFLGLKPVHLRRRMQYKNGSSKIEEKNIWKKVVQQHQMSLRQETEMLGFEYIYTFFI